MNNQNSTDYTFENISQFQFSSKNEIREAIKQCAKKAGFAVSTRNSYATYLYMGCFHYGQPRTSKMFTEASADCSRETLSRKKGCPFSVKASVKEVEGENAGIIWCITSISAHDSHNHSMAKNIYSYPMNRHMENADQKRQVLQMIQSFATNTSIARSMNAAGVGITPKDVANFRNDMNTFLKGDHEMKSFILDLETNGYTVAYSVSSASKGKKTLKSVFFAHESGISLARRFNEVVIIDATYRTNRQKLPFVNVVGVSNVGYPRLMSFGIAGGWIIDETAGSYEWFVQQLQNFVWGGNNIGPSIIITDSEQALLKPLTDIFPESKKSTMAELLVTVTKVGRIVTNFLAGNQSDYRIL